MSISGDNTREYAAANGVSKREDKPDDGNMTPEREAHLEHIIQQAGASINAKYRKGQAEHGGSLVDVPTVQLVDSAIEEAIDQLTYLLTIREKLVGR